MRIAETVQFVSQLTTRLFSLGSTHKVKIPENLQDRLLANYTSFISDGWQAEEEKVKLMLVIQKYIGHEEAEDTICEILESIPDWNNLFDDYSLNLYFKEFLSSITGNVRIQTIIESKILEIVTVLVSNEFEIIEATSFLEKLSVTYDINLRLIDTLALEEHLEDILSEYVEQESDWLSDVITDESEAWEKREEIEGLVDRIQGLGVNIEFDLTEFTNQDWHEMAMHNQMRRAMEKDD